MLESNIVHRTINHFELNSLKITFESQSLFSLSDWLFVRICKF
jgi:hypothetical protein